MIDVGCWFWQHRGRGELIYIGLGGGGGVCGGILDQAFCISMTYLRWRSVLIALVTNFRLTKRLTLYLVSSQLGEMSTFEKICQFVTALHSSDSSSEVELIVIRTGA